MADSGAGDRLQAQEIGGSAHSLGELMMVSVGKAFVTEGSARKAEGVTIRIVESTDIGVDRINTIAFDVVVGNGQAVIGPIVGASKGVGAAVSGSIGFDILAAEINDIGDFGGEVQAPVPGVGHRYAQPGISRCGFVGPSSANGNSSYRSFDVDTDPVLVFIANARNSRKIGGLYIAVGGNSFTAEQFHVKAAHLGGGNKAVEVGQRVDVAAGVEDSALAELSALAAQSEGPITSSGFDTKLIHGETAGLALAAIALVVSYFTAETGEESGVVVDFAVELEIGIEPILIVGITAEVMIIAVLILEVAAEVYREGKRGAGQGQHKADDQGQY